jgi:hypothetical protein
MSIRPAWPYINYIRCGWNEENEEFILQRLFSIKLTLKLVSFDFVLLQDNATIDHNVSIVLSVCETLVYPPVIWNCGLKIDWFLSENFGVNEKSA